MLDKMSMLWVNWSLVGIIYSQSNRFVTSVKIKVSGGSKYYMLGRGDLKLFSVAMCLSFAPSNLLSKHEGRL